MTLGRSRLGAHFGGAVVAAMSSFSRRGTAPADQPHRAAGRRTPRAMRTVVGCDSATSLDRL